MEIFSGNWPLIRHCFSPKVGLSCNDVDGTYLELPNSMAVQVTELASNNNINAPGDAGYYIFRVDRAQFVSQCPGEHNTRS